MLICCLASSMALTAGPAPANGRELKPALGAEVGFVRLDGGTAPLPPVTPFAIKVRIVNYAAAESPAGLTLFGWLRRQDDANPPCSEAAEAFLRTGRLPIGAVFLNDPLVAVATEDNALLLLDPDFSLATANLSAAARLPGTPAALVPDTEARRLLLPMPDQGSLLAVDATGRVRELASGLGRPVAAAPGPDGAVYVLDAAKGRIVRVPDGATPDLAATGLVAADATPFAAAWGPDGAVLIDTRDGGTLLALPGPIDAALALVAEDGAFGLAAARGREVLVRYLDAPDAVPLAITMAAPARRLAVSPGGRLLFGYDPAGGPVSIVDVARSRVVQTTEAEGHAVSEVIVSDRAAYLMLADQTRVGVLDLIDLAHGRAAEFREVPLGSALGEPLDRGGLMARLAPEPGILAVHAASGQGYRLADYGAVGNMPASSAMPIRGGVPREVAVIDRSFREGIRGEFETVASLPGPGRWELVATTGLGALSFCVPVPVAEPGAADPVAGRIVVVPVDGVRALRFRILDGGGRPTAVDGLLTFADLTGAWRHSVPLRTGADGLSLAIYDLPEAGAVALTLAIRDGSPIQPLVLEENR